MSSERQLHTGLTSLLKEAQVLPIGVRYERIERAISALNGYRSLELKMLVLSRKVGERIWIGENISVTVVRVTGGGVRLGIEAPDELPVVREELKERIEDAMNGSVAENKSEIADPYGSTN